MYVPTEVGGGPKDPESRRHQCEDISQSLQNTVHPISPVGPVRVPSYRVHLLNLKLHYMAEYPYTKSDDAHKDTAHRVRDAKENELNLLRHRVPARR